MKKIIKELSRKDKILLWICFLFVVIQVWVDLKIPDYVARITYLVEHDGNTMKDVLEAGGKMLGCAMASLATSFIIKFFTCRMATACAQDLRSRLFQKVLHMAKETRQDFTVSSLVTRTNNDVIQVQTFFTTGFQVVMKTPVLAIWTICKIKGKNWNWSAATYIAIGIVFLMIMTMVIRIVPNLKVIQKCNDGLNKVARENLNGLKVIRAFNTENYFVNRFEETNKSITDANIYNAKSYAMLNPGITFISSILTVVIYWFGAKAIQSIAPAGMEAMTLRISTFGEMVVFMLYASQLVSAFLMLVLIMLIVPKSSVSANRILEVLESENPIKNGIMVLGNEEEMVLEFSNVSFQYPNAKGNTLSNISFSVKQGEMVAIIGSIGSGKSTLVQLIPRLYDATGGQILFHGIDIKDYALEELRKKIAFVEQKNMLFQGNAAFNTALTEQGEDYQEERLKNALQMACIEDFIEENGGATETFVAQNGSNVSGGQKQRLGMARAFYKECDLLILDDAFSALDYRTDKRIRKHIRERKNRPACIVIAQRIGSIKEADKILVMDGGEVVGMGTHEQLLQNCEIYKEIAESQLSKE